MGLGKVEHLQSAKRFPPVSEAPGTVFSAKYVYNYPFASGRQRACQPHRPRERLALALQHAQFLAGMLEDPRVLPEVTLPIGRVGWTWRLVGVLLGG